MLSPEGTKHLGLVVRDPSPLRGYPETCVMAGVRPPMNSAGYTTASDESDSPDSSGAAGQRGEFIAARKFLSSSISPTGNVGFSQ